MELRKDIKSGNGAEDSVTGAQGWGKGWALEREEVDEAREEYWGKIVEGILPKKAARSQSLAGYGHLLPRSLSLGTQLCTQNKCPQT